MNLRPTPEEYAEYYHRYIDAVPDGDILARLETQGAESAALLDSIPGPRSFHRYAEGKWSIRELVCHVTDSERVFAYRALRIARGDETPLASFDHDRYVAESGVDARPWSDVRGEFEAVRRATLALLRGIAPERWPLRGTASGYGVTVRALAWITAGHEAHHLRMLRERYGVEAPLR